MIKLITMMTEMRMHDFLLLHDDARRDGEKDKENKKKDGKSMGTKCKSKKSWSHGYRSGWNDMKMTMHLNFLIVVSSLESPVGVKIRTFSFNKKG